MSRRYDIHAALFIVLELRTQILDADEVRIYPAPAYLVSSRLGYDRLAETGKQRAYEHDRAAQRGTLLYEIITLKVTDIHIIGLEAVCIHPFFAYLNPHFAEQLYEVVHIENVGHIMNSHFVARQKCGADDLQHLVFRALRIYVAMQFVSALNDKRSHTLSFHFICC